MTTFFSVDVETSGQTLCKGRLLTVGVVAVTQNPVGRWGINPNWFYARVDALVTVPLDERPWDSMFWWGQQDPCVQAEAFADRDLVRHPPLTVAKLLHEYVVEIEPQWDQRVFVANPVSFDKPWIDDLMASNGLPPLFHYRSLCLRSMKFGMVPSPEYGGDRDTHPSRVPHHAMWDAHAQAEDLIDMLEAKAGPR